MKERLFSKADSKRNLVQALRVLAGDFVQAPKLIGRVIELDLCPLRMLR